MTRVEFIKQYAAKSSFSLEELESEFHKIALPCHCDYEDCKGWQMVNATTIMEGDYAYNPEWEQYRSEIEERAR